MSTTYRGSATPSQGGVTVTTASDVTYVPYADLVATNVQDAINELQDEKVSKAGDTMTGALTVPSITVSSSVSFPDNSISGDDIDGGTISNFASTGIDDNATSTAITIDANGGVGIGNGSLENWDSALTALQFGGTGAVWTHKAQAAGSGVVLAQNVYADTGQVDTYIVTDEASRYYQINGTHSWQVAASGTADTAITWTTALTIDNTGNATFGGNVSLSNANSPNISVTDTTNTITTRFLSDNARGVIGTSTNHSLALQTNAADVLTLSSAGDATFGGNVSLGDSKYLYLGASNDLQIYHDAVNSALTNQTGTFYINNQQNSGSVVIRADDSVGVLHTCADFGGVTPYVRLYYNGVQVFQTVNGGVSSGTFSITGASQGAEMYSSGLFRTSQNVSTSAEHQQFWNPNGKVGSITTNGTSTAYNTTSDKRLKTSEGLLNNPFDIINQLEVHNFHFNYDPDTSLHGFMAQDVYNVYPQVVSKPENEEDRWGIDQSKFMPLLMAGVQDLEKRIKALESLI